MSRAAVTLVILVSSTGCATWLEEPVWLKDKTFVERYAGHVLAVKEGYIACGTLEGHEKVRALPGTRFTRDVLRPLGCDLTHTVPNAKRVKVLNCVGGFVQVFSLSTGKLFWVHATVLSSATGSTVVYY